MSLSLIIPNLVLSIYSLLQETVDAYLASESDIWVAFPSFFYKASSQAIQIQMILLLVNQAKADAHINQLKVMASHSND
jgi:hypothetical protein